MAEMLLVGPLWRRCWRSRFGLAAPLSRSTRTATLATLASAAVLATLSRCSAVVDCRGSAVADAIRKTQLPQAPGRIAYAAGSKERKRITACRCE